MLKVQQDQQVLKERLVLRVPPLHKVLRVLQDQQVLKVLLELKEPLVLKVLLELKEPQVLKVLLELRVLLDQQHYQTMPTIES